MVRASFGGLPPGFAGLAAPAVAAPAVHPTSQVCAQAAKPGMATCFAERQTDTTRALLAPNALPSGFGPSGLRSAHNLTAIGNASATVAIVDAYDDPNMEDLGTAVNTAVSLGAEYVVPADLVLRRRHRFDTELTGIREGHR